MKSINTRPVLHNSTLAVSGAAFLCPEAKAMSGWLEDNSVYVSVTAVDDGDVEDQPAETSGR